MNFSRLASRLPALHLSLRWCSSSPYTMSALPVRTASKEPSSFANLDEVRVKHVAFDWVVDFEKKVVRGSVTLDVHASADADKIVLDTRDLAIESVSLEGTPIPAFSLGEADAAFGSSLTIPASFKKDTTSALTISYTTSPTCTALNWLTPAQTSDGTHPYMFSQCEAIHARSLFPCQDTPGNRATYSAKVTAPHPLQVLMSALQQGEAVTEGGLTTTVWSQPVAIASYLVAVVVGFVEKRVISDRVAIWSEPGCVDMAAHDFRDTEKVVKIGEDIVGPYVWGRYDVVSLPGSFPYGGMENPCLTFVSPSIVTGDRSLFCVVAHEVAHSWTGNLVGPETWEDFYLNEGFTMFLERKIMSVVEGAEYFDLDSEIGLSTLKGTIESLGEDNPFTALRPALVGVDPDDSFSSVPYEKGFAFLIYLRDVVGDEAAFDLWLHDYIQDHKHQSITSEIMIAHLRAWFSDAGKGHTVDFGKVDWAAWLDAPGMPPVIAHKPSPLAQKAKDLADQWLGLIEGGGTLSGEEMSGWTSGQTCIAMGRFVTEAKKLENGVPTEVLTKLDKAYGFNASPNSEFLKHWLILCIRYKWTGHEEVLRSFLSRIGRMKFTLPLYSALKAADPNLAKELFEVNRLRYHPITSKMVGKIIDGGKSRFD